MNKQSMFKISMIAGLVSASFSAQSYVYTVHEAQLTYSDYTNAYGSAIQASNSGSCFDNACNESDYLMAVDTRHSPVGLSLREEAPFAMDNRFRYIHSQDDFEDYCYDQLGYATCDSWAEAQWTGYNLELNGNYTNAIVTVDDNSYASNENGVINTISSNRTLIGNERDGANYRNLAFGLYSMTPTGSGAAVVETRAFDIDSSETYTVGSASRYAANDDTENDPADHFTSKPAIFWSGGSLELAWGINDAEDNERLAQGSMRTVYYDQTNSVLYAGGYNNYEDQRMDATIFTCTSVTGGSVESSNCSSTAVANAESGDDFTYSNSVVTSLNSTSMAIGESKLAGDNPQSGTAANKPFFIRDITNPSAVYLEDTGDSLFFDSVGGKAGALNDDGLMVGQIDVERLREVGGRERRERAFIYPIDVEHSVLGSKAYLLDDLVNGASGANQYRIFDATDINNDGVISASAFKCEGGYDDTTYDSLCGAGSQDESIVAIKLLPVNGSVNANIDQREYSSNSIEREAGSLSWGLLSLLGGLGFMRRFIK
ncbi:DUF3466 family protein [Vibrio sp.]|nr:DUF3466 family protein [Vibrio sp.]